MKAIKKNSVLILYKTQSKQLFKGVWTTLHDKKPH